MHEAARVTFNSKYLETGQGEAMEMEDLVSQDDHLRPKHDYNLLEREAQAGREGGKSWEGVRTGGDAILRRL